MPALALVLVAAAVTGCAGAETGSLRHQVSVWVAGTNFAQEAGALYGDGVRIATVERQHRGTGALHVDCGVLQNDAGTLDSGLPTPDVTMTDDLSSAVQLDYQAGIDCYQAGAGGTAELARSAALRARADKLLAAAIARARAITGRTVSTTTTTSPDGGSVI